MAAEHVGRIGLLEFEEIGPVDHAGDHLAHVEACLLAGRHDAHQFFRLEIGWRNRGTRLRVTPVEMGQYLACIGDGLGIVLRDILAEPRHLTVQVRASKRFVVGVLTDGRLDQRRTGQEDLRAPAHENDIVRKARQIGAARRRGTVNHGDLRNARRREPCLVGEGSTALDEHFRLVEQVGTAAFDQIDQRQPVLEGDLLKSQGLFQPGGEVSCLP
jgi:hypothetical protein